MIRKEEIEMQHRILSRRNDESTNETDYSIIIIGDPNGLGTSIHPNVINVPELGLDEQTQRAFETLAVMNCSLFVGTQSGPWDQHYLLVLIQFY